MPLPDSKRSVRFLFLLFFLFLSPAWAQPPLRVSGGAVPALVEHPSQALAIAARRGEKNLTVLHVDARDDLWPAPTPAQIQAASAVFKEGSFRTIEKGGRLGTPWEKRLYSPSNYLVLAHRLGLVRNVFWAIPSLETSDAKALEDLKGFLLSRGGPFWNTEGTALTVAPPLLTGTISGVPVTIGRVGDFPRIDAPLWLDIELDFFSELYQTPVKGGFLGLLAGFVDTLDKKQPEPQLTTISYGEVGLSERFLGPWLQRLLSDPGLLKQKPPVAWTQREEALYQLFFQQSEEALRIYSDLTADEPDNPDFHYALGLVQLKSGREKLALGSLARAAALDPAYALGYLDAAAEMEKTKRPKKVEEFLLLAEKTAPDNPVILKTLAGYYFDHENLEKAASYYGRVVELNAAPPETFSILGDIGVLSGDLEAAVNSYKEAIRRHRGTPGSFLPPTTWVRLGQVLEQKDQKEAALQVYRAYLERFQGSAPPWREQVEGRIEALSSPRLRQGQKP